MDHYKNLSLQSIDGEVWKDIDWVAGYENIYQISNLGRVKSRERYCNSRFGRRRFVREAITKQWADDKGYLRVTFNNHVSKIVIVHRLVAIAFIPNPENKPFACHKDDNPHNPSMDNLFWGTPKENSQDCLLKGRMSRANAKLTNEDVLEIKKYIQLDYTLAKLGKMYNVTPAAISHIKQNRTYKGVILLS